MYHARGGLAATGGEGAQTGDADPKTAERGARAVVHHRGGALAGAGFREVDPEPVTGSDDVPGANSLCLQGSQRRVADSVRRQSIARPTIICRRPISSGTIEMISSASAEIM